MAKTALLIGGPRDGTLIALPDGQRLVVIVVLDLSEMMRASVHGAAYDDPLPTKECVYQETNPPDGSIPEDSPESPLTIFEYVPE